VLTYRKKRTKLPAEYTVGFLREFDQRTALFHRLNGIYQEIIDDCGGHEAVSHARLSLIERAVFLESQIQVWEEMIATDPKEHGHLCSRWIQATNALVGLYKTIGIERQSKPMLDLRSYVEERAS
jgi:hypothetical protein